MNDLSVVGLSVCLSSALWKNGESDPDAVWHHRLDGSGDEAGSAVWGSVHGKGYFWGDFGALHCNQWGLYGVRVLQRCDAALFPNYFGQTCCSPNRQLGVSVSAPGFVLPSHQILSTPLRGLLQLHFHGRVERRTRESWRSWKKAFCTDRRRVLLRCEVQGQKDDEHTHRVGGLRSDRSKRQSRTVAGPYVGFYFGGGLKFRGGERRGPKGRSARPERPRAGVAFLGRGQPASSPPVRGSGERCKLSQQGPGPSPGCPSGLLHFVDADGFSWHFKGFWPSTRGHILWTM